MKAFHNIIGKIMQNWGFSLFVKKLLSFCKVALAALLPGGRMWYTGRSKRVEAHLIRRNIP